MAQQTIVRLVDDLDDTPIEDSKGQTVRFGVDGTSYEIDLTNENADELRSAFDRYIKAARKVGSERAPRTGSSSSGRGPAARDHEQTKAIRDWAKAQGLQVSERGRIPATVLEQYNAASK